METALGMTKYVLVRAYVPHLRADGWANVADMDRLNLGLKVLPTISKEASKFCKMLVPHTIDGVLTLPHEFLTSYTRNYPYKPRTWPISPVLNAPTTPFAAVPTASTWQRDARAFCALRDAWDAVDATAWRWAWRWVALDKTHPLSCAVDGYLVLDRHFRPSRTARPAPAAVPADDAISADDAAAAPAPAAEIVEWEFHVLFSTTYGAPELRLRATWADGAPLSLAEVRRELGDFDGVVSREAHPVTGEAFVLFHGCCAAEKVDALGGDGSLLAWFAAVAPTVGLRVPPDAWRALRRAAEGAT
jgi:hypothetical protein